jgi:hypothetical protein
MTRPHSSTDALDPRRRYDTGIWATRRSAGDGEGGATQPEPKPSEGEPPHPAERRHAVSLGEPLMPLESLSIEELQRELDRRQGELKRLVSRRDRLARQLAELDAQIRTLGGDGGTAREGRRLPSGSPRPKRSRSKNEITLSDAIAMAVEVRATVTPTEVAQLVQANGYQSTSKNFAMMVANALAKDKRFRRLSRGQYERIA